MFANRRRPLLLLPTLALLGTAMLAACSPGGNNAGAGMGLAPGLSARMDQPGASLDRAQAIGIINAYRATNGLPPLTPDGGLDGTAQALANQYAATGNPPKTPNGVRALKLSAGYATFAETFSGWRNNPADAAGLRTAASKAGVAVAFNPGSSYGIYWVLILAD